MKTAPNGLGAISAKPISGSDGLVVVGPSEASEEPDGLRQRTEGEALIGVTITYHSRIVGNCRVAAARHF